MDVAVSPFDVVAVMVAVPAARPVTRMPAQVSTNEATLVLDDDHVTVLFAALCGVTDALKDADWFTFIVGLDGETVIPVGCCVPGAGDGVGLGVGNGVGAGVWIAISPC